MVDIFKLSTKGGAEVLKQLAVEQINDLARQVATNVGEDIDVEVEPYSTDRAAASVSVPAHEQAKDGVLTRAASGAGLEVKLK